MKRWARHYDKCKRCGSTEIRHGGNGMCNRCHSNEWRKKNRERSNATSRIWNHRKRFGKGNRDLVLARSDGKCVRCGEPATEVHHIDNDGEKSIPWIDRWLGIGIGHNPDRMEALCSPCHGKESNK